MVKKLEFWQPRLRGTPHFDEPKFCQILSFLLSKFCQILSFAYPENFMGLACVVEKFDFWQPHARGTPILVFQIVLKFMFLVNLHTLKSVCVQL